MENTDVSATGLRFVLPDDSAVTVPPVTILQACRALALHPLNKTAETSLDYVNRLIEELGILLGPSLDGLAETLPPITAHDLRARLWRNSTGFEPHEPGFFLARPTSSGLSQSAEYLLEAITRLRVRLQVDFSLSLDRVYALPLADALQLHRVVHPAHPPTN